MSDRDAEGHYIKGHPGGPGRPAKARELAYLAILREVVSLEEWRRIIQTAKEDALGRNWQARDRARRFLAEYAIGKPPQTIRLEEEGDTFDQFDELSDDELRAIVEGTKHRTRAPGSRVSKKKKR
jgi:hypothetical protein